MSAVHDLSDGEVAAALRRAPPNTFIVRPSTHVERNAHKAAYVLTYKKRGALHFVVIRVAGDAQYCIAGNDAVRYNSIDALCRACTSLKPYNVDDNSIILNVHVPVLSIRKLMKFSLNTNIADAAHSIQQACAKQRLIRRSGEYVLLKIAKGSWKEERLLSTVTLKDYDFEHGASIILRHKLKASHDVAPIPGDTRTGEQIKMEALAAQTRAKLEATRGQAALAKAVDGEAKQAYEQELRENKGGSGKKSRKSSRARKRSVGAAEAAAAADAASSGNNEKRRSVEDISKEKKLATLFDLIDEEEAALAEEN